MSVTPRRSLVDTSVDGPMPDLNCPVCEQLLVELPSFQSGWWYFRHAQDVVIVCIEMIEVWESIDDAFNCACEALHADSE